MTTARYRDALPQTTGEVLLTDGGIETTLIFQDGFDLPEFAAFPLLGTPEGRSALDHYYRSYIDIARAHDVGIVLETPTWRASADWGAVLGYDTAALARVNTEAVTFLAALRDQHETPATKIVVSGCLGPRGDGYEVGEQMTVEEARAFHTPQIRTFADAGADMVSIITMTYANEATGAALAARDVGIPIAVAFTVETDGHLPTGQPLGEAVTQVDEVTDDYPVSLGINCAHPDHFSPTLAAGGEWTERIGLIRANASRMSHEELDSAEELDPGDRAELGELYADLHDILPNLRVMGGCCGTDAGHIAEIGKACFVATAATV